MKNLIDMLESLAACFPDPNVATAYNTAANLARRHGEAGPRLRLRFQPAATDKLSRSAWFLIDEGHQLETMVSTDFANLLNQAYGVVMEGKP